MIALFNSSLAKEMTAYIDLRISTFSVSSVYNDKRTLVLLTATLVAYTRGAFIERRT